MVISSNAAVMLLMENDYQDHMVGGVDTEAGKLVQQAKLLQSINHTTDTYVCGKLARAMVPLGWMCMSTEIL